MNRSYFLGRVRGNLFSGKLSKTQADGLTKILDYWQAKWPKMSIDELAYLLATVKWETAHTMQPVTEYGSSAYLKAKKYYPWIGRGLVQITWKANYVKFGIHKPEQALEWPTALDIAFRGMIFGMFTDKKLADYIGDGKRDYVGARKIINGTDKAKQIANIAEGFRDALLEAHKVPEPDKGVIKEGTDQTTGKSMTKSSTAGAAAAAGVAGAAKPTAEIIKEVQSASEAGKGVAEFAASVGPWVLVVLIIAAATWWIIRERRRKSQEEGI